MCGPDLNTKAQFASQVCNLFAFGLNKVCSFLRFH